MFSTATFQRITFSLPKQTILKLEMNVPKQKRSKFIAELIEKSFAEEAEKIEKKFETLEGIQEFFKEINKKYPNKLNKTAAELIREDRMSH